MPAVKISSEPIKVPTAVAPEMNSMARHARGDIRDISILEAVDTRSEYVAYVSCMKESSKCEMQMRYKQESINVESKAYRIRIE